MNIPFSPYDFFGYLSNGFLIICAFEYAFFDTSLPDREWKVGQGAFYLVLAYIIGHIAANFSSYFLEHLVVRKWLRSPEETLFEPQQRTCRAFLFPIFYRPFPAEVQKRVMDMAHTKGIEQPGRGLFLHAHALVKHDKTTMERLDSFLRLYGFSRNISAGLMISAILLGFGAFLHRCSWSQTEETKLIWAGAAVVASVAMFYRYLKFFKHYTTEVLVSYAELKEKSKEEPKPV